MKNLKHTVKNILRIRKALINGFKDYKGWDEEWFEKQGGQPRYSIGDVLCDKSCTTLNKDTQPNFEIVDIRDGMYICDKCSFPISQQDEYELVAKKLADKFEPKFKVGDWIVKNDDSPIHIDYSCCKIIKIENGNYRIESIYGYKGYNTFETFEKDYHPWTIQDAKNGDILCCESGWTCIFKTLVNDETFSSYCFMDKTKWFCETGSEGHTLKEEFIKAYNGKIYPATKEQRDLLFKKMRESGYEWDAQKKELKKIEQKPWSEEDGQMIEAIIQLLYDTRSENCWNCIFVKVKDKRKEITFTKIENWLKSLKDRVQPQSQWKPSDEQITWLYRVADDASKDSRMKQILNELLSDLKKLREG